MKFRDRVKGLLWMSGDRIVGAEKNFRRHDDRQRSVLQALLGEIGIAGVVLVWVADDAAREKLRAVPAGDSKAFLKWAGAYRGSFTLYDGHLRDEIVQDQPLPMIVTDLDRREAAEALATFDPVGDLAGFDQAVYVELLHDFNASSADVQELVASLANIDTAALLSHQGAPNSGGEGAAGAGQDGGAGGPLVTGGDDARLVEVAELRAPFPWFGGKSRATPIIWGALGEVVNYVEPFAGSMAALLARPGGAGRVETVNDLDQWIANFWRAVTKKPLEVAQHADWPVNEADLHARHGWLLGREEWRKKMRDHKDPMFCDPLIAGWWVWGICAWIGSGWCSPGRLGDDEPGVGAEQLPHLSDSGQGVNRPPVEAGAPSEQLPHLGNPGRGVHRGRSRSKAPSEQIPHLTTTGSGVHRSPSGKERGKGRRPSAKIPELGNSGRGVHRALSSGPTQQLPHLQTGSRGGHRGSCSSTEEIIAWMRQFQARLRRTRIACGDFARVLTPAVTTRHGLTGVLLDPPYKEGASDLYNNHDKSVSTRARAWAIEHGNDPLLRIVFCGYEGEHEAFPPDWRVVHWKAHGGYGSGNGNPYRERLYLSPHCLSPVALEPQGGA